MTIDIGSPVSSARLAAAQVAGAQASQLKAGGAGGPSARPAAAGAYAEFESFILQSFVETMLPKDNGEIFGSGVAGQSWKSMMAEMMAKEMAKAEPLGLAKLIEGARGVPSAAARLPAGSAGVQKQP